jgi:putative endonuclease
MLLQQILISAFAGMMEWSAGLSKMKQGYVYILANKRNGTLYVGVTSNLAQRIYQHKNNLMEGFTRKFQIHQLVYFEARVRIDDAIAREKSLKKWRRKWKLQLIEGTNPDWRDLYGDITQ